MDSTGGTGDSSPLRHFTVAKKKVNQLFLEIASYIQDFDDFINQIEHKDENLPIETNVKNEVHQCLEKIVGIKEMLGRNHMKVVFFGRTSNGKSTVINAMLKDKILPSGIGHTTNCFLSITGCNAESTSKSSSVNDGGYILCDGSEEKRSLESVSQLGHALSDQSLSNESLIQVFWPRKKCALLKDDIVLVDSPGIDVTADLDQWIDNYCLDADVFVLVANAESTLMQAEKNFFHRVNEKLSDPNVFILNNRWDASASEPEFMEQVRQQHLERGISFLADELKVVSQEQAKDRVFFVSAKETLNSRLKKPMQSPGYVMAEGYQARLMEFSLFERKFEQCISKSATRTKFNSHVHRASNIVESLFDHASHLFSEISSIKQNYVAKKDRFINQLAFIDSKLKILTESTQQGISAISTETERLVRIALSDEIKHLPLLVDEFQRPFHPNEMVLRVYKSELYRHVGEGLGRNLNARCSNALQKQIDRKRSNMVDDFTPLLVPVQHFGSCLNSSDSLAPTSVESESVAAAARKSYPFSIRTRSGHSSFDISYDIDCANLCADFQADIQFKFSLGFMQLMERFIGPKQARRVRLGGLVADRADAERSNLLHRSPSHPAINGHEGVYSQPKPMVTEDLLCSLASGYMNFTQGHSAVFISALGMVPYMFWKLIGWQAVVFSVASYGALYCYERMTWTNRAKEKALKRQFVEHASEKLNLVISFTSSNCSHQVQQELSSTFTQLCMHVEQIRDNFEQEIKSLENKIMYLDEVQTSAKTLKNKAGWLSSELANFSSIYLTPD